MGVSSFFPPIIGFAALLATAATLTLDVFLAYGTWSSTSPARILVIIAFVSEAVVSILLVTKLIKYVRGTNGHHSKERWSTWFALDLVISVLASVVSVALLIVTGKAKDLPDTIAYVPPINLVIGSAVALGFAFTGQLFFSVVYFILHRLPDPDQALSLHTTEEGRMSPQLSMRVKSIPYERTKPALSQTKINERGSSDFFSRPGTSGGRSAAETISSFSGSLSSVVRPIGSKTRLLSSISRPGQQRLGSLDSTSYRDRTSVAEDGFDSWDTSSVDPRNRQIIETSSPLRTRFLETIPASPATSRSPSPGCPLDLEPPKRGRRERSDSPVSWAQQGRVATPTDSELHIHPLFRSDSPGPPPPATPGTVVVAAPNAGQFITGKSVSRMRSGSSPNSPSPLGPLSRQGSYESFRVTPSPNDDRLRPENVVEVERKMTPPIPEWVLNAGSRTSLTEYHNKGRHTRGGHSLN
ncbi:hypothetical protein F4680DRAFT_303543 [Xylaria scruposa]|nr:hypothetical protein F4680DRAFT_303543 [Xylaria scruposa]